MCGLGPRAGLLCVCGLGCLLCLWVWPWVLGLSVGVALGACSVCVCGLCAGSVHTLGAVLLLVVLIACKTVLFTRVTTKTLLIINIFVWGGL